METQVWLDKYKPKKLEDIAGNRLEIQKLKELVKKGKAVLLYGPTGVGKTCAVQALASEMGADLIEMNASEDRTKDAINEKMFQAGSQQSLFMRPKILLIDEADGLTKSGESTVLELTKKSRFPVVVIANDPWSLVSLKYGLENLEFRNPTIIEIAHFLRRIAESEGIEADESVLKQIASQSGRDVRAAINDFELVGKGRKKVGLNDLTELGYRDREANIFESLKIIFKTLNPYNARRAIENLDLEPDMLMMWIEENIGVEYDKPEDLALAYDAISKADIFAGRIIRRQGWSLMKHQLNLMSVGVALAKKEMYRKFTRYQFPKMIKKMSASRATRTARKEILSKLGSKCHCSIKTAAEYLPLLKKIGKNIELLDEDELKVVKKL